MKMSEIRNLARRWPINLYHLNKAELIRKIQSAEGNFACLRTAEKTCDQQNCLWLDDCLGKADKGPRR